jgi:hypothetical protein
MKSKNLKKKSLFHQNWRLLLFSVVVMLAGVISLRGSSVVDLNAAGIPEDCVTLTTGPSLATYKAYQRYEGYRFTVDTEETITSSANTALVLKFENNRIYSTGFAFYLNGTLNTGSSATPTTTYLYQNTSFVQTISHGSYGVGYYIPSTGANDYNYVVVPLTNFSNASPIGTEITVQNFTIAIRLKGVADNATVGTRYSETDANLYGAYLSSDFDAEASLNVAGLEKIYTPGSSNYLAFDSGNTGITAACIVATYHESETADAILFAQQFNSAFDAICDAAGNSDIGALEIEWENQATAYASLSSDGKISLTKSIGDVVNSDLLAFCYRYDFMYGKYSSALGDDFAARNPIVNDRSPIIVEETNDLVGTIAILCGLGLLFSLTYFVTKRRFIGN